MKKLLSLICICTLLLGSVAYAADPVKLYPQTVRFTTRLEAGEDVKDTLGEAVIFMIENNILARLYDVGEEEFADALKLSADAALDASANSSEDAADLAVQYCTKLEEAMQMFEMLPLIENGDFTFTYALTENIIYESSTDSQYNITLSEGTLLPMGWELTHLPSSLTDSGKSVSLAENDSALGTTNSLVFTGTAFVLSQRVSALTPGQSYKLSLHMSAEGQNGVSVTVNYLNYNASFNGTFTKTVQLCGDAVSKSEDCSVNFTLPPDANAADIIITINGGTKETVRIDNIALTESEELITNGTFENYRSDEDWFTTWNTTPDVYPRVDGTISTGAAIDNYAGLDTAGEALCQAVLVKPERPYKLCFDYAQSGLPDTAELLPDVTLTYSGNNGEEKSVIAPLLRPVPLTGAAAEKPAWTTYEAYVVTPAVPDGYAFELVNMTLEMSAGQGADWADGAMVYYDDVSLVEVDTMIGFTSGPDGSFVADAETATTASCIYVQPTADTVRKFIVAKYSKETDTLTKVDFYDVGENVSAGETVRRDIPLDTYDANYYYMIFLWTTLEPVVASQEIR